MIEVKLLKMEPIWQTLPLHLVEMICNKLPQVRSIHPDLKKEISNEQWRITRISKSGYWHYYDPWKSSIIFNRLMVFMIDNLIDYSILHDDICTNDGFNIIPSIWEIKCRNIWALYSHDEKIKFEKYWLAEWSNDTLNY